jgi:succinoglycan biosynthesis protein ExoA
MPHTAAPKPKVLVVIPCLNEEDHLEGLLHKLITTNFIKELRFVIVDGGSTDRTPQIAQALATSHTNVNYLQNPKRIQSAAINLAITTYGKDADYLIRIDAHADYPERYCETLLAEAQQTGADSVVVAMRTIGKEGFQRAVAAAQNSKLGNGGSAHRVIGKAGRWIDHGHHALMRIAAFRAIGGYDESFRHNEDAELDMRLQKMGYKIWLTGNTTQTYYPRTAPLDILKQYIGYGFGRASTILKHRSKMKIRQLLPVFVAPAALLACFAPWASITALPFLAWAVICLAYGGWLAVKAGDSVIATSGPAAMLMHFGWSLGFWKAVLIRIAKV